MADLVLETDSESPEDALRSLARRVYWRSQEVPVEPAGMRQTPSVMVWLGQLAHLQRACLALCVFGGLTHREAADLLDVPPRTVAELLTAGLRELGQLAAAGAPTSA
ncbi:MAG: sigma factor-like helix-turn-helix DNA-binding protein [Marmoricola sp.]